MRKNIFSALVIFLAGIIVGYILTLQEPEIEICKIEEKSEADCKVPECDAGKCPTYNYVDVDKDQLPETVITVPYLMTKGVAAIWIVEDGEVLLKTPARPGTNYKVNNILEESEEVYLQLLWVKAQCSNQQSSLQASKNTHQKNMVYRFCYEFHNIQKNHQNL